MILTFQVHSSTSIQCTTAVAMISQRIKHVIYAKRKKHTHAHTRARARPTRNCQIRPRLLSALRKTDYTIIDTIDTNINTIVTIDVNTGGMVEATAAAPILILSLEVVVRFTLT